MVLRRWLVTAMFACSGKTAKQPDAHTTDATVDAPPCQAMASYGTPSLGSEGANSYGSGSSGSNAHALLYGGKLNNNALFDLLDVELFAGTGAFAATDITTGSFNLATEDADYSTCGACVLIFTQYNASAPMGTDPVGQYYLATGGTLNLTGVGSGSGPGQTLQGTLSNATFDHVTIDPNSFVSTKVADGCATAITSATLAGPIKYNFSGKYPALFHRYR